MKPKFDIRVPGPLTKQETDKALIVAGAVEEALGSRDPKLHLEVVACLLGGLMYDICGPRDVAPKLSDEEVEEATIRLFQHALERVKVVVREATDLMIDQRDRKG